MVQTIRIRALLLATTTSLVAAQDTCLWQGQIFQRGESLGSSFETLCGSYQEFPCYCNPDFNPPIECPYCGFAQQGGDLLCAEDTAVVTYTDLAGVEKTCECSAPAGGTPTPNCDLPPSDGNGGGTCTIDLPDGTSRTFNNGESLGDFLPNRCGSEFPCFCNPAAEGQIECPYCRFASIGGNLACAKDGDTISFQDILGAEKTCSCQIPSDPTAQAITNCIDGGASSPSSPVSAPTIPPVQSPISQTDVCTLELPSGQIITFQNGESYGEYMPTRCQNPDDFPCFCNTALHNQVECPYCGFSSGDGTLTCAKDQESVSFTDGSITRTCSCEIPDDPSLEPIRSCRVGLPAPTPAPIGIEPPTNPSNVCTVINASGEPITVPDGEPFGDLIEGECGPGSDWPAFCNAEVDVSRRQSPPGVGNVVYPYCIFEDTTDGNPVCARNNDEVTYVNENGLEVTCGCVYLPPALGGPETTCRVSGDSPTQAPIDSSTTEAPGPSDESSATSSKTPHYVVAIFAAVLFIPR